MAPDWPDLPGVRAWMTTRDGGVSRGPWASLNLGAHVGDRPEDVAENRRRFAAALGAEPRWLNQVHGATVVDAEVLGGGRTVAADGVFATRAGQVCAVLVADCLPVLLAVGDGRGVAAAHAGWRGLAAGVLSATVAALCQATGARPDALRAWLGPCIGPERFEVGDDVREAFQPCAADRFRPHRRADGSSAWLADLPQLARDQLQRAGVEFVSGGRWCTVEDRSRFFSFRRDGVTGRMAAGIVIGG